MNKDTASTMSILDGFTMLSDGILLVKRIDNYVSMNTHHD